MKKKKILALLLTLALVFALAACGAQNASNGGTAAAPEAAAIDKAAFDSLIASGPGRGGDRGKRVGERRQGGGRASRGRHAHLVPVQPAR